MLFFSCGKKDFAGVWHFDHAMDNFDEFQKLKEAGLDIKLIVYPDESRFELFTSTGGEYKKINEGRLGKLDSMNGHWYFNLPDRETGGTITGYMEYDDVVKELMYNVDDGKLGSIWWFARGNTSGSATY